jgi:hypothetical protein
MPKILMICHAVLLLCLSLLVFPARACVAPWVAIVATALAALLFVTEMLSGLRWPAGLAVVAAIVGLITGWGGVGGSGVSAWAWGVAWCAVVLWFALLALEARENR